jgi:hypothetical protein
MWWANLYLEWHDGFQYSSSLLSLVSRIQAYLSVFYKANQ